jgi:enoyl-CoA hydratase
MGLVNRVVPLGRALDVALDLARVIGENGPLAVEATKRVARESRDWTVREGWDRQADIIQRVRNSDDAREGATAFAEKRRPTWKGR